MKNWKEIKGLINPDVLENQIKINSDGYGGACVKVAMNVMKRLDSFKGEFNIGYNPDMTTPHGIICKCDDQGGLTGFMAGAARNIVAQCHKLGWKFYLADVISQYDIDKKDRIEKVVNDICKPEHINVSKKQAFDYIEKLIERYRNNENATKGE